MSKRTIFTPDSEGTYCNCRGRTGVHFWDPPICDSVQRYTRTEEEVDKPKAEPGWCSACGHNWLAHTVLGQRIEELEKRLAAQEKRQPEPTYTVELTKEEREKLRQQQRTIIDALMKCGQTIGAVAAEADKEQADQEGS